MPPLHREPLFAQIAALLRKEIERNGYPGLKLGSERDLAQRFAVSPVTIREALGILREEGLIERRHGSGSYILERRRDRVAVVLDYDIADGGLSRFFLIATQAARRALMQAGFDAPLYAGVRSLIDSGALTCREFVADVQESRLKGVVAIAASPDPAWVRPAEKLGIPIVGSPRAFRAGVTLDHHAMVADGVGQLVAAGRRHLAMLDWSEPQVNTPEARRSEMFAAALREAGLTFEPRWVCGSMHPSLPGSGWEEFRQIWTALPRKPDGLLVIDDMLFADAKLAILELGVRVPRDLMVVTHANRGSRTHYPFPVVALEMEPDRFGHLLAEKMAGLLKDGQLADPVTTLRHHVVHHDAGWSMPQPQEPALSEQSS